MEGADDTVGDYGGPLAIDDAFGPPSAAIRVPPAFPPPVLNSFSPLMFPLFFCPSPDFPAHLTRLIKIINAPCCEEDSEVRHV